MVEVGEFLWESVKDMERDLLAPGFPEEVSHCCFKCKLEGICQVFVKVRVIDEWLFKHRVSGGWQRRVPKEFWRLTR